MIIGRFLDLAAARYPDKSAIVSGDRKFTYTQLREWVQRLMTGFSKLGVRKGDRICTLMENCSEQIEIYLAAARLGAVFTPLNFRLKETELLHIIQDARPSVLVTDENFEETAWHIAPNLAKRRGLFSTSASPRDGFHAYESLVGDSVPFSGSPDLTAEDPCQILYTSGTTGQPKGVVLTHENVVWNTINMLQARGDRPEDVALIVGPLFHAAALNSHYTSRLALGATSIIMSKFDPVELMEVIQNERVTVVSGTPTMFIMLMESCAAGQYDTSSVTTLTSGADKLADSTKKAILEYFPGAGGIYDVYGCTECSPCVTTLDKRDSLRKTGSVGRPLPFVEVKLLDDEGQPVPAGEPGEIVVRGPVVMKGYYGRPEETAKVLKHGWLYTGDVAWADEEGFLYVVDRKKDIIVSGGENIFAREVEEHLLTHPSVLKAAVFGLPDPKWGEKVAAAVVLKQGQSPDKKDLLKHLRGRISNYKMPKEVFFLDQLPEGSTGKVQKQVLRETYTAEA
ncbi:MAG: long-chain fatty acid--CoA ligase [Deltaproteobacteria bacterium]|nr:long-chain fatty acid--CoA ligase [Deltaproteobacteria bacterium]MBW1922683.1 long-chain fatty acid--CoA ligase [Deltaproteobacteria bacterium]MBW2007654.1 long-chain fatty acid--CoA ligase [Deltaproteobacteria bacterium]